jgi:hypothetical protein
VLKQLDALLPWLNDRADVNLQKVQAFVRSFAGTPEARGLHWAETADWERWVAPQARKPDWDAAQMAMQVVLCPEVWPDLDVIPVRVCLGPHGGISGLLPDVMLFFAMRLPPGVVGHCRWCDRLFPRRRGRGQPRKDACSSACKQALHRRSRAT